MKLDSNSGTNLLSTGAEFPLSTVVLDCAGFSSCVALLLLLLFGLVIAGCIHFRRLVRYCQLKANTDVQLGAAPLLRKPGAAQVYWKAQGALQMIDVTCFMLQPRRYPVETSILEKRTPSCCPFLHQASGHKAIDIVKKVNPMAAGFAGKFE